LAFYLHYQKILFLSLYSLGLLSHERKLLRVI
jgi:hypothetical protein